MSHFGMQMTQTFETIEYYTYGLIENYNGRNHSTDLVIYCQCVDELFYSYIRPQETETKTYIR